MTEFEKVLQECLRDLEQGTSNVDECLSRYPTYAAQLRPILLTGTYLERVRDVPVSEAFKARVRSKLIQEMHAHPRKLVQSNPLFMRLAMGLGVVLLALLATGTAYAQSTLPGNAFYTWKLASEHAWRAVSADPLGTDLVIVDRRADELIAVRNDPALYPRALKTYVDTATRLRSEADPENQARILLVLDSQIEELKKLGILLSQVDPSALPSDEPTAVPITTLPAATAIPSINPTDSSQAVPTVQVSPEIVPTIKIPPELVPTIEVPPPIN